MKVSVTQEHITQGKRGDPCRCPVALAIRDETMFIPLVEWDTVQLGAKTIDLPKEATAFIIAFDGGKPVEPIEFELGDP